MSSGDRALRLAQDASKDPLVRAAHLVVALTSSADKASEVAAALSRKFSQALVDKYTPQITALWEKANAEAAEHLNLVVSNNPAKDPEKIIKRPDVQEAMKAPFLEAAKASEALLKKAWAESEKGAVKQAKAEFKLIGAEWKGHESDEALLNDLVGDLYANAKGARTRYEAALRDGATPSQIEKCNKGAPVRARYTLSVGVWSIAQLVRETACMLAGINRRWVSRNDANTCKWCKALHGKVVAPGQPFPKGKGLKTYKNKPLWRPPRHPNCRCVVVPTTLKKN